ncbi:DNA polymerase III subunit delta [soil metagenome]
MSANAEEILQKLKSRQFAPVYFLQGEEPYYIDLIADYIEAHVLTESEKGFNQVVMYGKDADMAQVMLQARRFPMMAERQVVIVKEAQNIQDIEKEAGSKQLEAYLQKSVPSTVLVLCYKHKLLDGRKALAKVLQKQAVFLTTKKLYDNQVPGWVSGYVRSKGLQISPKATMLLSEYIGADLSRLANEIDKVALNLQPQQMIDEKLVQENVGISKEYNIFELQTALIQRNAVKAFQIIRYFESDPRNNPLIPMLSLLFSFFTKLLTLHLLPDKSEAAIARSLGNRSFLAKEYLQAMRAYDALRTIEVIHHIRVADLQSKGIDSPSLREGEILRELGFKILHPVPEVPPLV